MASPYKEIPIPFDKGLVTEIEESVLDVGQASALVNWEPLPNGAMRCRPAWSSISTLGLPDTEYKVRGWGTYPVPSSGGGSLETPSIAQVASSDSTQPVAPAASHTATLTSTTAGNVLVAIIHQFSDHTAPTVTGWTFRASATLSSQCASFIYTKTSAGGTQACTATANGSADIWHVQAFELVNVATEAPTDTDTSIIDNGLQTIDCVSPASSGIALFCWQEILTNGAYGDEPGGGSWTTRADLDDGGGDMHFTNISQVYSTAAVTDDADANSTFDIMGLGGIWDAAESVGEATPAAFYILLAIATGTGYELYRIERAAVEAGTWELLDSADASASDPFVSISVGSNTIVWSATTMESPRAIAVPAGTASDITDLTDKAGRATTYHKDRMFVAGPTATPSRMYFSNIGDPDEFTTATDFLDVGGDDGEAIEDLVSVEGLLLVCKTNRLYLISGSGIENFFVNELPGGSAATGRSSVRTPYGTIVAGPDDIWVVQGGGVDPMSRPLGADYSISGLVSAAYGQDTVLISDSNTGTVYRVNLVTGAWMKESITQDENAVGHLFSLQGRLYYGVYDSDTAVGGTRRLSSERSFDAITGGTTFLGATGRLALLGPSVKYTARHLFIQSRNRDQDHPNTLFIDIETDQGTETKAMTVASDTQRDRFSAGVFKGAEWLKLTFRTASSAQAGAIDVERVVLGVTSENQ